LKTSSENKRFKRKRLLKVKRKMALKPLRDLNTLISNQWDQNIVPYWRQYQPSVPWINDFGFGLFPHEVRTEVPRDMRDMERRFRQLDQKLSGELAKMEPTVGKDGFQVCVDVHQFTPKEITIKAKDRSVIVEAKHDEHQDEHGYISREFCRRYVLPEEYDANTVTSELSTDGILTIKAPLPKALEGNERFIPIQATGAPARLSVKENKPNEAEKEKKDKPKD
jgi:HSP20 family molecular chaperone IbpA